MNKIKRMLSMLLTVSMLATILPLTVLADTVPSEWAASEVALAEEANLVTEKIKDDYQKEITREEFCELIVKLYTAITGTNPDAVSTNFTDIVNDEISKAYGLGIVYGVSDTEFAPYKNITRQEICTMLVRCIDKAIDGSNVSDYPSFSEINSEYADASQVANWALPSVSYAIDNEIMKGVYAGLWNTLICPLDDTTREQAVLMIWRVFDNKYNLVDFETTKGTESIEMSNDIVKSVTVDYTLRSQYGEVEITEITENHGISETVGNIGYPIDISLKNGDLKDATINFNYDRKNLNGINEDDLSIAWYDEDNDRMVVLNTKIDKTTCTASAKTNHFSEYILIDNSAWYEAWRKEQAEVRNDNKEVLFDIVFAVDASGSMEDNDPQSARKIAVYNFITELYSNDSFAVISFDGKVKRMVDFMTVNTIKNFDEINTILESIQDDGSNGTNIHRAIKESINILDNNSLLASQKMIVLLTDGDHNGTVSGWSGNIESSFDDSCIDMAIEKNIKIYTIALGDDIKSGLLQDIANKTGGKHYKSNAEIVIDTYKQIKDESLGYDSKDNDGDGIPDAIEKVGMRNQFGYIIKTDPLKADTDGDGLFDGTEMGNLADEPLSIINPETKLVEKQKFYQMKSNPLKKDSDNDGLDDKDDVHPMHSDIYIIYTNSGDCTHTVTENRAINTEFKSNDEFTHTEITQYQKICLDCDSSIGAGEQTEKTMIHRYDENNICIYCGFKTLLVQFPKFDVNYSENDAYTHKKIVKYNSGTTETLIEVHDFNENKRCVDCNYNGKEQIMQVAYTHSYDVNGSVMYKNMPYPIVVPKYENGTNQLKKDEWNTVKEISKTSIRFDWSSLLNLTQGVSENVLKANENENSLVTTMAWIDLFGEVLDAFDSSRIKIILQEKGEQRRAIIKTTIGIFGESLYGKSVNLSEELNNTSNITIGVKGKNDKYDYAEIGGVSNPDAPYGKRVADAWVRKNFSTMPYRADKLYDLTISLDKNRDHTNFKEGNEYYSSYIAYDKSGKLRLYPIWFDEDTLIIHETGNANNAIGSLKTYMIEHMSIPLDENDERILQNISLY